MPNPDVFVSYAHEDRDRVAALVRELERPHRTVWWDPRIPVGSRYRSVIDDALAAASAVVAVWSTSSVDSDWVLDEAQRGLDRGVLMPVRIDPVRPPTGFGQLSYTDLLGWPGSSDGTRLRRLLAAVDALVTGLVTPSADWVPSLETGATWTVQAARDVQALTVDVAAAVQVFRSAPASIASVAAATAEIRKTYEAVLAAVDAFLDPAGLAGGPARYRDLARDRLSADVAERRGHCTAISLAYWAPGGIREALTDVGSAHVDHLDEVFARLGSADGDLFRGMLGVTVALAGEAAALANLLTAGQAGAARARLDADAVQLAELETVLNGHMAELNRFLGELGVLPPPTPPR